MPPLLGALHLIVLLLGVLLALLLGVAISLVMVVLGPGTSQRLAVGITALAAVLVLALVELVVRWRQSRRELDGTGKLDALGQAALERVDSLGGEARRMGLAARLGVPIPDGVVVPAEVAEQWLRAQSGKNTPLRELLPHAASAPIEAFLHRSQGAKIALRPSFDADDRRVTYTGVFPSTELAPSADEQLRAALNAAAASAHGVVSAAYRRRVGVVAPVRRAFVLQRVLEAEVSGRAESRGLGGAADSVLIDFARVNSPRTAVSYDLAEQRVRALAPDTPLESVPTWMHRLALLLVGLEGELGGPVTLDYAVENGQIFVTSLQRSTAKPKSVWLSDRGPIQAIGGRVPRFVRESLGGAAAAAEGMSGALRGLGRVAPEQVRDDDGVVSVDFEALRPALGKLAMNLLAREPLWSLFALLRPASARALPALPEATADSAQSFRRFKAYREKQLEGLRRDHFELVLRGWLVRAAINILGDQAQGQHVPALHRRLGKLLGKRARSLGEQAERARADLERQDEALQGFVTALVTRGATDFSAMFVGDRQLYASLAELELWCDNPTRREQLGASWDEEKAAFASRQAEAPAGLSADVPAPAPPSAQGTPVIALVPGKVSGDAHAPDPRAEPSPGKVVFLADGRSDYAPHVLVASGVVLTGGGLTSPMAGLARELGIPTVACVQRKPIKSYPIGSRVALDADASSLRY